VIPTKELGLKYPFPRPIPVFDQVLHHLSELGETNMRFGSGPTRTLLDQLDSPDKHLRSIIIAGTNGKGSTCAFLTSVAMEAGLKVGTYTSPHLESVTERISLNGQPVDEKKFGEMGGRLIKQLDHLKVGDLTYFEFFTILAVMIFQKEKVDLAIFEVGLGGRLDATNALKRDLVAITAIDFDHEKLLGNSLTTIAQEKGAIMRPGLPVIVAEQKPEARLQLHSQAQVIGAGWSPVNSEETFSSLGLHGPHQIQNARCAATLARTLSLTENAISRGLANAHLPGRLEKWNHAGGKVVWLDIAHNPAAARSMAQFFSQENLASFDLIWGMIKDKKAGDFLKPLQPFCSSITLCTPPTPRAWHPETIRKEFNLDHAEIIPEAEKALREKLKTSQPILGTGSFYLVGALRPILRSLDFRVQVEGGYCHATHTRDHGIPNS